VCAQDPELLAASTDGTSPHNVHPLQKNETHNLHPSKKNKTVSKGKNG
jgi:hypothetical protein